MNDSLNIGFLADGICNSAAYVTSLSPYPPTSLSYFHDLNHEVGKTVKRKLSETNNKEKLYELLTGKELYILANTRWDSNKKTIKDFVGILTKLIDRGYFDDACAATTICPYYPNYPKSMMERPEHHIPEAQYPESDD